MPLIILGALLTVLTATALGAIAFQLGRLSPSTAVFERYPMYFGAGCAILSNIVFVLCAVHAAWPAVFLTIALVALAAAWSLTSGQHIPLRAPNISAPILIYGAILSCYLVAYSSYALAPEIIADGVTYHLGFVRQYALHRGFPVITTNIYAFVPHGFEMLFLFAYSFGMHSAAKLVHFATAAATVATMIGFAQRYNAARAGWLAAVLYLCASVVSLDASSAYNDCALAFVQLLVLVAFMCWLDEPSPQAVALVGGLAGFCFAIKYTGGVALLASGLALLWVVVRRGASSNQVFRTCVIFGAAAATFVLPWTLKNLYITGNPFSPLFNGLFPNEFVTPIWEHYYTDGLRHFNGFGRDGIQDYLLAPLEATIWGGRIGSIIGPVFLLFPVVVVGWRSPLVRSLVLVSGIALLPWFGNVGARFLIPMLPFAALAIAVSLEYLPWRLPALAGCAVALLHGVLSWQSVMVEWHPAWLWRIESPLPWAAALREIPEEEYLASRIAAYDVGRRIDSVAQPGDRVLAFEQLPEAYMDTPVVVCFQGAIPEKMFRNFQFTENKGLWPSRRLTLDLGDAALITGFRVSTTNAHPSEEWALTEIQFLRDGVRISPATDWKVDADPYPWDADRLTDGDEISSWYSGEVLRPGMRVEIRFPGPIHVSEIQIVHPNLQQIAELEFQFQLADDSWQVRSIKPSSEEIPIDVSDLQYWAGLDLKRRDIDLVLVNTTGEGHNFVTPQVVLDPASWGMEEVFREGTYILYRVTASD